MPSIKDDIAETKSNIRATANGDAIDVSSYRTGMVALMATLTGAPTSPTLDVSMETSNDGTTWRALPTAWAFSQLTTTGGAMKQIPPDTIGRYIRLVYTIGGSGYVSLTKTWDVVVRLVMSK